MARRILHVIPRWIGGGPERSIVALAHETRALGIEHEHTAAVLDPPLTPTMVVHARRASITLAVRPNPQRLCALVAGADVVQVHYWNHPALTACLRTVELPPARVLLWCHVLGTAAPQVLTADVGHYADRIIVTSALSLEAEGARAAAEIDVPVDVVPAIHDASRLAGYAPRPHEACVVGYLGTVHDGKMHPRFAGLCAKVTAPDVRFEVFGGGGGEDALRQRAAALGIAERMDVRGPTEDIRAALEGFDIFGYPLAPDAYATSEKALQEAMWVGVPPVVFDHGGPGAVVVDGESGLVVASEDEYVHAIERLAADPSLRARLGAGARRRARTEFAPARHAATAAVIVDELMTRPRRARPRLPGGDESPAMGFVRSLGEQAGALGQSVAARDAADQELTAADEEIALASATVARGEGGIVHHRNASPDDPHLRLWSGLVAAAEGDVDTATAELRAAAALGLDDGRPGRYEAMLASGWPSEAQSSAKPS